MDGMALSRRTSTLLLIPVKLPTAFAPMERPEANLNFVMSSLGTRSHTISATDHRFIYSHALMVLMPGKQLHNCWAIS